MKKLEVYDIEYEDINALADEREETVAVIVEALMDAVRNGDIDIDDYL